MSRLDWSRPLPRPMVIPEVMKLATLDDVRRLVAKHLPAEHRSKFAWRKLAALLRRAAQGKDEAAEVSTALQIILKIERVPFQVQGGPTQHQRLASSGARRSKALNA